MILVALTAACGMVAAPPALPPERSASHAPRATLSSASNPEAAPSAGSRSVAPSPSVNTNQSVALPSAPPVVIDSRAQAEHLIRIGETALRRGAFATAADAYEEAYVLTRAPGRLHDLARVNLRWYDAEGDPARLRRSGVLLRNYLSVIERMPAVRVTPETMAMVGEVEAKLAALDPPRRTAREATTSAATSQAPAPSGSGAASRFGAVSVDADVGSPGRADGRRGRDPIDDRGARGRDRARERFDDRRVAGTVTIAGAGVFSIGVVTAIVFLGRGNDARDRQADNAEDWLARDCGSQPDASDCQILASNRDALAHNVQLSNRLTYAVSVPAITIGAATTVVGALLLRRAWARAPVSASVTLGRSSAGFALTGRF